LLETGVARFKRCFRTARRDVALNVDHAPVLQEVLVQHRLPHEFDAVRGAGLRLDGVAKHVGDGPAQSVRRLWVAIALT
jgi:hypothetical protein